MANKPTRKRSLKPKAGVIDLEAMEIESQPVSAPAAEPESAPAPDIADESAIAGSDTSVPDPDTVTESDIAPEPESEHDPAPELAPANLEEILHEGDDPLGEEPAPNADDPELFEAEPRSHLGALIAAGVAGAIIALLAFVALLASGLLPFAAGDAALGSRVADLEAQLQKQAVAPPAPVQPAESRADLIPPPAEDSALRAEVDVLKQEVERLRSVPTPAPQTADPQTESRIADLSARIDQLAQTAESRASSTAFDQLAARVDAVSAQLSAAQAPDPAVQDALTASKSAASLAAISALESAIARGTPYASALTAVRRQLPDSTLASLETGAEKGVPNPGVLAARLAEKLEKAPAPASTATGFVDRLTEGARGLVRVRPVDGSVPEVSAADPWSARNAVSARLGQGDYAGALGDWEKLDPAAKDATRPEADALKARIEIEATLDALRAAALGETKP